MTDDEFDAALIKGAFALAAKAGWTSVSVVAAAREADLPLDRARLRFAGRDAILLRFGKLADAQALAEAPASGPVRERLFDLLMRRFDALQANRAGVIALLRGLPGDPASGFMLAAATGASMRWMVEAAGVPASGFSGLLAANGLVAVWLYALRAWERDESADLATTMAALDRALSRAEQAAGWLLRAPSAAEEGPKPFPEPVVSPDPGFSGVISGAGGVPPAPDEGGL
jgi:hypothetical protein